MKLKKAIISTVSLTAAFAVQSNVLNIGSMGILSYAEETQYTYEITPLLEPFNEYFFVRTDNPNPESFRFIDKSSVYSDESTITPVTTAYADVIYEDVETYRVNGGYIFSSFTTDGGEVQLQTHGGGYFDTWEDAEDTFTLPELCDDIDYLIDTYATETAFFDNMDAVQSGFSSICLYSGSTIRGELVVYEDEFWSVCTSPHIDQSFYLYSIYGRKDSKRLFTSSIYPFRYDSLGFPSVMGVVSQRLDSSSTYEWSQTSHAYIHVTYGEETHTYGGQGNGKGQAISEDKISRFYSFDEAENITLDGTYDLLFEYATVEMIDDIPKENALTWSDICNTVGEGSWIRNIGGYSYLYKANDSDSYSTSDVGTGSSLYWGGSLGYYSDAWVDGRYISPYEEYVPGAVLADFPTSKIIVFEDVVPVLDYTTSWEYDSETESYKRVYDNIEVTETTGTVTYIYDETLGCWKSSNGDYNLILEFIEQGLVDEKYIDILQLTYEEAQQLGVDRNTNKNPEWGYIYDGTTEPGTKFLRGDINCDGSFSIADAVVLQKWLLNDADTVLGDGKSGDLSGDGILNVFDLCLMKQSFEEKGE